MVIQHGHDIRLQHVICQRDPREGARHIQRPRTLFRERRRPRMLSRGSKMRENNIINLDN